MHAFNLQYNVLGVNYSSYVNYKKKKNIKKRDSVPGGFGFGFTFTSFDILT